MTTTTDALAEVLSDLNDGLTMTDVPGLTDSSESVRSVVDEHSAAVAVRLQRRDDPAVVIEEALAAAFLHGLIAGVHYERRGYARG